jgi:TonB family protein
MSQMQRVLLPVIVVALLPASWGQDATPNVQPADAQSYLQRATKMQMNKQWDAVVANASQAILLDRDLVPAYGLRAHAFRELGRFNEAIADYSELIRCSPESRTSFYQFDARGSLYLKIHKAEQAAADAEVAIRLRPDEPHGYLLRGEARTQLGDNAGAAQDQAWADQLEKQSGPQRIGGNVMAAMLVHKVEPEYPDLAKQVRVKGVVRFSAVVGKDGTVESLKLLSGDPLLVEAATTSVQQWQYKPTLLNGEPVRVATTVDVNFTLTGIEVTSQHSDIVALICLPFRFINGSAML